MKSYLIQRGRFKEIEKEEIVGIDCLIRFDYMGSSEFEYGGLPQSLRRMAENIDKYIIQDMPHINTKDNEFLYIYCNKENIEEVKKCVEYISKNKYGYKEYCDIIDYIKGVENNSIFTNNFWWDIENDFMVCFGKENIEKVEIGIKQLNKKWYPKEEGIVDKIKNIILKDIKKE